MGTFTCKHEFKNRTGQQIRNANDHNFAMLQKKQIKEILYVNVQSENDEHRKLPEKRQIKKSDYFVVYCQW